jgi:5'-methylthioadenosine phosphorylase
MNEPIAIKIGVIGGTGLGAALSVRAHGKRHSIETPFGQTSDAIIETTWSGLPVFFLSRHGPGHLLNPSKVPYRANIFALKVLGVTHIIAGGAVGSLRDEFKPRDLVIPEQLIDKTRNRADTFFDREAVHVEFSEPFDPVLRRILVEAGEVDSGAWRVESEKSESAPSRLHSPPSPAPSTPPSTAPKVHDRGCYVAMEGPAFSTRAESLMHRLWGGDLIGMTAMPEAKLAREAEIAYALVAMVTDFDSWKQKPAAAPAKEGHPQVPTETDPAILLKEIIANLEAATQNAIALIQRAVALIATRQQDLRTSPALQSLKLAIWSDKTKIDPERIRLLSPLWGRYFGEKDAK